MEGGEITSTFLCEHNVAVVNLEKIAIALGISLKDLFKK
jgi:hypothetical protein